MAKYLLLCPTSCPAACVQLTKLMLRHILPGMIMTKHVLLYEYIIENCFLVEVQMKVLMPLSYLSI